MWHLSLQTNSAPNGEEEEEGDELTGLHVSDLTLYLDHEDPGLRGTAAKLVCKVSPFLTHQYPSPHNNFFNFVISKHLYGTST
jgi:hypothetical protein